MDEHTLVLWLASCQLHLWQKQLPWEKINLNERSNLMYLEEEGEEINPKKYLKVVGIDWVIKRKK